MWRNDITERVPKRFEAHPVVMYVKICLIMPLQEKALPLMYILLVPQRFINLLLWVIILIGYVEGSCK